MNQESLNNNVNNSNNIQTQPTQPAQPTYTAPTQPAQPTYTAQTQPVQPTNTVPTQPAQPTNTAPVQPVQPTNTTTQASDIQQTETSESIEKVSNLNKEDAMEEALSHTNQYTPFEVQQEEVNQETSFMSNKKALIFLGVILGIMLLFIIFLPQISKIIGW